MKGFTVAALAALSGIVMAAPDNVAIILPDEITSGGTTNTFLQLIVDGCTEYMGDANLCDVTEVTDSDYTGAIDTVMTNGETYDVVITATFSMGAATSAKAAEYPNQKFAIIDVENTNAELTNLLGVIFKEEEGGVLAGIIAASLTTTKNVGIILGSPFRPLQAYNSGFYQGVTSVCRDCNVRTTYVPSFSNATLGENAVDDMVTNYNVDVIFGAGGAMGSGAILHAADTTGYNLYVIGVGSDYEQTFDSGVEPGSDNLVTAVQKSSDGAVALVLGDIAADQFVGGQTKFVDIAGGGLELFGQTAGGDWCASTATCSATQSGDKVYAVADESGCAVVQTSTIYDFVQSVTVGLGEGTVEDGADTNGYQSVFSETASNLWKLFYPFPTDSEGVRTLHTGSGGAVHVTYESTNGGSTMINNNHILIFGGKTVAGGTVSDKLWDLNYDRNEWQVITPSSVSNPGARERHTSVGYNNDLYIFGGQDGSSVAMNELWGYDPVTLFWTQYSSTGAPSARTRHAAAVANDNMYVFGGRLSNNNLSNDFYAYNFAADTWSQLSVPDDVPAMELSTLAAANSTHLILFGGSTGTTNSNIFRVYDTVNDAWTDPEPTGTGPSALSGAFAVAIKDESTDAEADRRVLIGGGGSSSLIYYNFINNSWDSRVPDSLPFSVTNGWAVSMTQAAISASDDATDPCTNEIAGFALSTCTVQDRPVVLIFDGAAAGVEPLDNLLMYPQAEEITDDIIVWFNENEGLRIAVMVIASLSIVLAVLCMGLTWMWRKRPAFRVSTADFLQLILVGCVFGFCTLITEAIYAPTTESCNVLNWFEHMAYVFIFAPLFLKTYRIRRVFNAKHKRVKISDNRLLLVFVLIAFLAAVALTVWSAVPSLRTVVEAGELDRDGLNVTMYYHCSEEIFGYVLLGLELLFLLFGCVLAWGVRNAPEAFNEARFIGFTIYQFILLQGASRAARIAIDNPDTALVISLVAGMLAYGGVMALMFFPKIYAVVTKQKVVDGKGRLAKTVVTAVDAGETDGTTTKEDREALAERLAEQEEEIKRLRMMVESASTIGSTERV
eukprot:Clim_evm11s41 gene=Clim_evmTU11s41